MKPAEYYALTEKEYLLLCDGYRQKEIKQLKLIRQQSWITFLSYADPKKAPASMQEWWPIDEGKQPQKRTAKPLHLDKKRLLELDKKIGNAKKIE